MIAQTHFESFLGAVACDQLNETLWAVYFSHSCNKQFTEKKKTLPYKERSEINYLNDENAGVSLGT